MDIQKILEKLEKEVTSASFITSFKKDPVKAIEKVVGVDLPDDQLNKAIDFVKAKITADQVSDLAKTAGSLLGKFKK